MLVVVSLEFAYSRYSYFFQAVIFSTLFHKSFRTQSYGITGIREYEVVFYDRYIIAKHGEIPVNVAGSNINYIILNMTEKLMNKEIDGFLVTNHVLMHHTWQLQTMMADNETDTYKRKLLTYIFKNTVRTEEMDEVNPTWGIIMKERVHSKYFGGALKDN